MAGKTKVFIACDIPEVVRKKCAQIQTQLAEELPKVKWVNDWGKLLIGWLNL